MSLLPSRPDAPEAENAEPRVIDVDSDDADDVLAALSSSTARELLAELHEQPAPPAELADRIDTSVQNAQYHLDKLRDAGAIEVVDTAYSEKGREMDVFAPADQPLVIYAGDEAEGSTLRTALSRLLGAVGVLAGASLAVQALFGDGFPFGGGSTPSTDAPTGNGNGAGGNGNGAGGNGNGNGAGGNGNGNGAGGNGNGAGENGAEVAGTPDGPSITGTESEATPTPNATETPEATPTPEAVDTATEAAAGLPPGLLFFLGGVFALAVIVLALRVGR